jgi:hypothetical protein
MENQEPENQEKVKVEVELPRDLAEFAEFYAKIINTEKEELLNNVIKKILNEYKAEVLKLPMINHRQTEAKKTMHQWQIN